MTDLEKSEEIIDRSVIDIDNFVDDIFVYKKLTRDGFITAIKVNEKEELCEIS